MRRLSEAEAAVGRFGGEVAQSRSLAGAGGALAVVVGVSSGGRIVLGCGSFGVMEVARIALLSGDLAAIPVLRRCPTALAQRRLGCRLAR